MTRLLRISQQLGDLRQQVARNDELLHRQMKQAHERQEQERYAQAQKDKASSDVKEI